MSQSNDQPVIESGLNENISGQLEKSSSSIISVGIVEEESSAQQPIESADNNSDQRHVYSNVMSWLKKNARSIYEKVRRCRCDYYFRCIFSLMNIILVCTPIKRAYGEHW